MNTDRLLLIDLDGVVIYEAEPPLCNPMEIVALHKNIVKVITDLGIPAIVLTHRSRREAARILQAAKIPLHALSAIVAAEDLFVSGLKHKQYAKLARQGLRKSLVLPEIEMRFKLNRENIAFIDDRIDNVDDMLDAGLGLILHAPSAVGNDHRSIITFDFYEAAHVLVQWAAGDQLRRVVPLSPIRLDAAEFQRTGLNAAAERRHPFNSVRTIVRKGRNFGSRLIRFARTS